MVVIVREEKQGKMIKVYKTGGDKVTPAVTKMADAQDKKIEKKMREIEKILKTRKPKTTKKYKSLIELKEKKGLVLDCGMSRKDDQAFCRWTEPQTR